MPSFHPPATPHSAPASTISVTPASAMPSTYHPQLTHATSVTPTAKNAPPRPSAVFAVQGTTSTPKANACSAPYTVSSAVPQASVLFAW